MRNTKTNKLIKQIIVICEQPIDYETKIIVIKEMIENTYNIKTRR